MHGVEYENRPDEMQIVCNKNFESFVIFRISVNDFNLKNSNVLSWVMKKVRCIKTSIVNLV